MVWISVLSFGVLGVASRFALDSWIANGAYSFLIATLVINILGSFIGGLVFAYGYEMELLSPHLRIGLLIGFCGGFTTFSGFALQLIQQIQNGKISPALIYGLSSPVLCVIAVYAGLQFARSVF
jgi:fluoride exporter